MVTGVPRGSVNVMSYWYWPPVPAAAVPVMRAGFPPANDSPWGRVPTRAIFPSLAEMANDPGAPTVNAAMLELTNVGSFTTFTGNGLKTGPRDAVEPTAIGATSVVKVPLVPAGGM